MLYPNRKLNIVNSPKLAYNMNYDVAKQCYYSCKEKWLLFKKQPVSFLTCILSKSRDIQRYKANTITKSNLALTSCNSGRHLASDITGRLLGMHITKQSVYSSSVSLCYLN